MLAQAIEAEVAAWIDDHAHLKDEAGRRQVVRNGSLPERTILTGLGADRGQAAAGPRPAARRSSGRSSLRPILPPVPAEDQEPRGVDPLALPQGRQHRRLLRGPPALLGPDAQGLSANTVTRLKAAWEEEHEAWSKRSLAGKQYVYVWADGVHFNIRLEEGRQCILVLMGATADGKKELIAIADGYRESEQSWKELLLD